VLTLKTNSLKLSCKELICNEATGICYEKKHVFQNETTQKEEYSIEDMLVNAMSSIDIYRAERE